jgi:hypothetical protein
MVLILLTVNNFLILTKNNKVNIFYLSLNNIYLNKKLSKHEIEKTINGCCHCNNCKLCKLQAKGC